MSDIVIKTENLGKKYTIGHQAQNGRYVALRDVLMQNARGLWHKTKDLIQGKPIILGDTLEEVWALKDVSFEIRRGEAVGIIGRNGAGKSTLLKVLSRITEPSAGRVTIKGRVASLLEVGTGFHPELTGRENIYLNGTILGMTRQEIKYKFDEIVAFAEIDKYLDTPVKRYSSGMYVRLAFAVAAHLEPEILVVDEVLAVGDAQFQKKCLGKMGDVAKEGRTVLFVSHNMPAVTRLCQHGILLDAGHVILDDDVFTVTSQYMQSGLGTSAEHHWDDPKTSPGDAVARLRSVQVLQQGVISNTIDIRLPVTVEMDYWNFVPAAELLAVFSFVNDQGTILFVSTDLLESKWGSRPKPAGLLRARCTVPGNMFAEGQVSVVAEVSTRHPVYEIHFLEFDSVCFQVVDTGEPGSVRAGWGRNLPGVVRPMLAWEAEYIEEG